MKTYYYVYRPGTMGPRRKHDTLASAEAEAKRLAVQHPGAVFEILQCLGIASTPVPAPSTFWLDGCEPRKLLTKEELANVLTHEGLVNYDAIEDPIGFDNGRTELAVLVATREINDIIVQNKSR